jgi:hypothetical protein
MQLFLWWDLMIRIRSDGVAGCCLLVKIGGFYSMRFETVGRFCPVVSAHPSKTFGLFFQYWLWGRAFYMEYYMCMLTTNILPKMPEI